MHEENGILGKVGKREKLEHPARVAELKPEETLRRIGFHEDQTLCDIGAGSGLFSLAAARLGARTVWAVDTDEAILADLQSRAAAVPCLQTVWADGGAYPLAPRCADWILLVTVLHEIEEKSALFSEIRRLLKAGGRVCLIEFQKASTPMGPPPAHRLGAEEADALFAGEGFSKERDLLLGENFYCQTYHLSAQP